MWTIMDNLAAFVAQPLDRIQNEYYAGKNKTKTGLLQKERL